ncbi:4'-phosphopantetheinyl transferase superfamily protein [Streptomyces sp. NPDC097619]|uniref:4'-phosphopantetheinyl transferase family protein n=1 Tax=Streptomyces sp. NPDC097619 TaxID=3157228 RepID=UPI00331D9A54
MPRIDLAPPAPSAPGLPRVPRPLSLDFPPGPQRLADTGAQVWLADATREAGAVEELARRVLDEPERARARLLRRASDRRCYLTAHVALRVLLGAYTGTTPERVRFRREPCPVCGEPHGRPAPADPALPVHFSLSHSGDLTLIAFATAPVGVDVQTLGSVEDADEVRGVLHPREEAELTVAPPRARPAAFARAWVRKEAYLKGLGTGLARNPALDYLGTSAGRPVSPPDWTVSDLAVTPAYAAALALRTPRRAA